ncbi:collagen-like protein [Campylobacter sp. CNRCH_2015_0338h]|uniref:collagen-like protein n=1 Tax=Campylobacter sp. CNRCH_2015_0338h TaxID=2911605 RepID=UPI0021E62E93|nr:collagen-like protein [Campylobacter sp. CNRCH_2015_0338h]MCV3471842.1 collagen-like protein [Campylobacter sp. CNRCH_2015_0338h]
MSLEQVIQTQNESLNELKNKMEKLAQFYENGKIDKEELIKIINEELDKINLDDSIKDGILSYITENQASLKGEKGDAFTYEDFTPEQLQSLKGDSGAKGEDGKSAYEIWLNKEGNAGKSEDEFLASLKGEKGDKGEAGEQGAKGEKGDKGDSISKEELKPIVKEVVDELGISNGGIVGEDGQVITDDKLKEVISSVTMPFLEENIIKISTIENNCLSTFLNAMQNNALMCNIANTPPPEKNGNSVGYEKGFIWVDKSTTPNTFYVSNLTEWVKVELSKEIPINKLSFKVSRNNVATTYSACCVCNFGLIDINANAVFAKEANITTSPNGSVVFEINGKDYTATISSTIPLYGTGYTYNIFQANNKSLLSGALTNDGIYEYTLIFDQPLPANIMGFGLRPYGNVVSRDWAPKMILEAFSNGILEPMSRLEKIAKTNAEVSKKGIYAIDIRTGDDISKDVTSYSQWNIE